MPGLSAKLYSQVSATATQPSTFRCPGCKAAKPRGDFHKNRQSSSGLQPRCKRCAAKDQRMRKYGLSDDDVARMLIDQQNQCGCCGDELSEGFGTVIDHCHATGVVRRLLCRPCNSALGFASDSRARLKKLDHYLASYGV